MSLDKLLDGCLDLLSQFGFPVVLAYHMLTSSIFFNVATNTAVGWERAGDTFLIPFQYLCAGKEAVYQNAAEGTADEWQFRQRFCYEDWFWVKSIASLCVLPPSFTLGTACKAIAYVSGEYFNKYNSLQIAFHSTKLCSHLQEYETMGMQLTRIEEMELQTSEGYARRPEDQNHLQEEKQALQEIGDLLTKAGIVWWVDCGTLLGAYRYGGVIPWDFDIDIAVLLPDFNNVFRVLQNLNERKYIVMDWSGRNHPQSLIRVYLRKTNSLIDIYHFAIDAAEQKIHYILSLEENIFLSENWRVRERRFKTPVAFQDVFPLKKMDFDGISVPVPQNIKAYLQRYYGENLSPVKILDPVTGVYEKDLSHPYWQRPCVH